MADVSEGVLVTIVDYPGTGGQPHHLDGILGRVRVPVIETLEGTEAGMDLLALITQWRALKINPGDMERSLTDTFIQELKLLAQRADCLSPLDKVYGLPRLFPASVSCAIKVDYSREPVDVVAEFALAVPLWDG